MADKLTNDNGQIENGLRADIMRKSMENKNLLTDKGSIYVGTGEKETIVVQGENVQVAKTQALKVGSANQILKVKDNTIEYGFVDGDSFGSGLRLPKKVTVTQDNLVGTIGAEKLKDLVNTDYGTFRISPFGGTVTLSQQNTSTGTGPLGLICNSNSSFEKNTSYEGIITEKSGTSDSTKYTLITLSGVGTGSDFEEGNSWEVYINIYNTQTQQGYYCIPFGVFTIPYYSSDSEIHLYSSFYKGMRTAASGTPIWTTHEFYLQLTPSETSLGFSGKLHCYRKDMYIDTASTVAFPLMRQSNMEYTCNSLKEAVEQIAGSNYSASVFFVNLDTLQNGIISLS